MTASQPSAAVVAKAETLVEAGARSPVNTADLRSWRFYASVQMGIAMCVPVLLLGIGLGQHLPLATLVGAVFCGGLMVASLATLTGLIGVRVRRPAAIVIQTTFGTDGAKLVTALLVVSAFGWYGVQTEMLVRSVTPLFQSSLGITVNRHLMTVIAGVLMSTTAVIGFRALGKVVYVAGPLLLSIIVYCLWRVFSQQSFPNLWTAPPPAEIYSFGLVVSIASSAYLGAVATAPDMTRFLRTDKDTFIGVFASIGFFYPTLLALTAILGIAYATTDLIEITVRAGIAAPAGLALMLATWASNDKNLYEGALSLSAMLPRVKRWQLTAFAGLFGTILATVGIFDHFLAALTFFGIAVSPIAGVYLVDYVFHPRSYARESEPPRVRVATLLAWVGGIVFSLMTLPASSHGFELFSLTQVPTLDGVIAAAIIQFVVGGLQRRRARALAV